MTSPARVAKTFSLVSLLVDSSAFMTRSRFISSHAAFEVSRGGSKGRLSDIPLRPSLSERSSRETSHLQFAMKKEIEAEEAAHFNVKVTPKTTVNAWIQRRCDRCCPRYSYALCPSVFVQCCRTFEILNVRSFPRIQLLCVYSVRKVALNVNDYFSPHPRAGTPCLLKDPAATSTGI